MKRSLLRLFRTEAVRFLIEEKREQEDPAYVFNHILQTYLALPRKMKGKFRLTLERCNHIGQFEWQPVNLPGIRL